MPVKTINDYTFYKIICLDDSAELCYVGSTANFNKRRHTHKYACNNETSKNYNQKKYQIIRENGGWCNFKMIEIGKAEQLTKREAEQIEEQYRQELRANMNSMKCYLTEEDKREYHKQNDKQYRQNNRDYYREYLKQYNLDNRDKKLERNKQYYQNNQDKILERAREKITCECGCELTRTSLSDHRKSKKHIDLMSTKN